MPASLTPVTHKPNPTFSNSPWSRTRERVFEQSNVALNQWIRNAGVAPQIATFRQLQAAKYPGPDRVGHAGEKASHRR